MTHEGWRNKQGVEERFYSFRRAGSPTRPYLVVGSRLEGHTVKRDTEAATFGDVASGTGDTKYKGCSSGNTLLKMRTPNSLRQNSPQSQHQKLKRGSLTQAMVCSQ